MQYLGTGLGINGLSSITAATLTTTSITAGQVIMSVSATVYRSAEFVIQGYDATGAKYQCTHITAVHNGSAATYTEYGDVNVGGQTGTFSVDYSSSNMRLLVTPASTNSTIFKVTAILTAI